MIILLTRQDVKPGSADVKATQLRLSDFLLTRESLMRASHVIYMGGPEIVAVKAHPPLPSPLTRDDVLRLISTYGNL